MATRETVSASRMGFRSGPRASWRRSRLAFVDTSTCPDSTTPSVSQLGYHIIERGGLTSRQLRVGRQAIADELLAVAENEVLKILRLERHDHCRWLAIDSHDHRPTRSPHIADHLARMPAEFPHSDDAHDAILPQLCMASCTYIGAGVQGTALRAGRPSRANVGPSRDEDQLAAGPIWRLAHLVNHVAGGSQRRGYLVPVAKAQRGVRGQHRTIGLEDHGRAE